MGVTEKQEGCISPYVANTIRQPFGCHPVSAVFSLLRQQTPNIPNLETMGGATQRSLPWVHEWISCPNGWRCGS